MNVTVEQAATLHNLLVDHGAQEAGVIATAESRLSVFLYDSDDRLVATATVDDLGAVRLFEWTGAAA